jgi:hypothetical protein
MKVKVQVVTITDDGQETIKDIACVERHDLTPETLGLSVAEGKAVLQALQEVVVEWQMHTYLQQQHCLSALWEGAPEQGCPSHGVSDRLWGAPCRQSPVYVSPTRPRVLVPWQRCCRNARPRTCSTWNP